MQISQTLSIAYCLLFQCQKEYPSDPLAEQGFSSRTGRNERLENEIGFNIEFPIVSTQAGSLEGYTMKTIKGRSIFAFEGIPYAETTGGVNRFRAPIPKANWTGIRQAKKVGNKCSQLHFVHAMRYYGDEDCLFLNVYTPSLSVQNKNPKLPVLVFIHGGSWFFSAGSEQGPSYLLEHDMILVTLNYRLGIFGHSAGGASVHLHMMSELSKGKFARAISISGNAYSSWAIMNEKERDHRNRKLASATQCPLKPSEAFVRCLRNIDTYRLTRLFLRLYDFPMTPSCPLGAVIEENIPGAFLTAHPDELYAKNAVAKIPFIATRNLNETAALFTVLSNFGVNSPNQAWNTFAPGLLDYKFVAKDPDAITEKINEFYFRNNTFPTKGNMFSELATDRIFGYGVHKSIQIHSKLAPTYSWLYAYQGRQTLISELVPQDPEKRGVSHTDDLSIYFNMTEFSTGYKTTDPEYAIIKLMTSLISNFVSKGEPLYTDENGNSVKIFEPVTDPRNVNVLLIDKEVKMIPEPHLERLKFWEKVGLDDVKPFIPIK